MKAQDILKASLKTTQMIFQSYVSDLTDTELLERPGPGCNSVAWQLGHLISSNTSILNMIAPGAAPALPAGFDTQHSKAMAQSDDVSGFLTKEEYLVLFNQLDQAIVKTFDQLTEDDLDRPSPEPLRSKFPTIGSLAVLLASHAMMHAGQFVPIRRRLNKPVLI